MPEFPSNLQHVAIYLRKSRADVEAEARGEGETLAKHRKALFAIAKKYAYTIQDIFEEVVSGERIVDRVEVQKLLHNVKDGKYDAVLCMDIDRLGRGNQIDQGIIQETFKDSNTLIITSRKVYDLQDELDEEWSEFESFMARREYKIIKRRLERGRRSSAAEGKSITGKPPYGYMRDGNFKLHPHPDEAPVVKQIFAWQAEGFGIIKIANMLTDLHAPTPRGDRWYRMSVRNILNNEVYLGRIIWGKYRHVKKEAKKTVKVPLPREEWIIKEDAHAPLVSQELWNAAHLKKEQMTPSVNQDKALKNPLAGILRCKECGKMMRLQTRTTRAKGRRALDSIKCVTYQCNTRSSLMRVVEERVLADLAYIVSSRAPDEDVTIERQAKDDTELLERKLKTLEDDLMKLQAQKSNQFDLLEQKVYDVDTFMLRSKEIAERIDATAAEIANTKEQISQQHAAASNSNMRIPAVSKAVEQYRRTENIELRNQLLKSILIRVEYTRHKEWDKDRECELEYYFRI